MYQQYLNQAVRTLQNLSSDELKDLLNDDDKLDERVDLAVSENFINHLSCSWSAIMTHPLLGCYIFTSFIYF